MKACVGSGLVDEDASRLNSVEGDDCLGKGSSSVEVGGKDAGLARRKG